MVYELEQKFKHFKKMFRPNFSFAKNEFDQNFDRKHENNFVFAYFLHFVFTTLTHNATSRPEEERERQEKRNLFVNVDGVGGSCYAIFSITVMFFYLLKTMWHRFLFESGIDFLGRTPSCKLNDIHRFSFSKIVLNFKK